MENSAVSSITQRWLLTGMTALVTGGTRGLGRAIVEELAQLGATVHTISRNQDELNKCIQEWTSKGFKVTGSVCDASSREQRIKLMETVSSVFAGKLNILVNNIGTGIFRPAEEFTHDEYTKIMSTNLDSCFHLSQLAYPLLKSSGLGNVVFNSSVAGLTSLHYLSVYGLTKGAINQLTKNLACEWAKDNIRVNCVAPWFVRTSLTEEYLTPEFVGKLESRTPMRRLGRPEEVSGLVVFFCLPAASYITGQVVAVDGGMTVYGYE